MFVSHVEWLTTGLIVLSSVYSASKSLTIRHQYQGMYGQFLAGIVLMGVLFGVAHIGWIVSLPHGILSVTETVATIGILVVVAGLGYLHPRLSYTGGDLS
ncbi:hypothetical protein ACFQE1_01205 [Halobium palmae]|uniref:Uncharacterized protein n=1 Tax=Halobium palmae TaxID=1776492 RepID=A0ABD5RVS4_9EURY